MKTILYRVFLLILSACCYACGNNAGQADRLAPEEKQKFVPEITAVVQTYLNAQYAYLTSGGEAAWANSLEKPADDQQKKSLDAYIGNLEKVQLRYTAYTSKVTADSVIVAGDTLTAVVTDDFSLTTSDRDPNDTTQFIITRGLPRYDVTLVRKKGVWSIRRIVSREPSRFFFNTNIQTETLPQQGDTMPVNVAALAYSYNAQAAVNYARQHWRSGNPAYCEFSAGGGDCTNFLSQCLLTGGWTPQPNLWESKLKAAAECRNCRNSSCEAHECYTCRWTVAQDFKFHMTNEGARRVTSTANITELVPGDIIQYGSTSHIRHSTIVVNKVPITGGGFHIYVSYRTSGGNDPYENRPYQEVPAGNPYGWRVKANAQ